MSVRGCRPAPAGSLLQARTSLQRPLLPLGTDPVESVAELGCSAAGLPQVFIAASQHIRSTVGPPTSPTSARDSRARAPECPTQPLMKARIVWSEELLQVQLIGVRFRGGARMIPRDRIASARSSACVSQWRAGLSVRA